MQKEINVTELRNHLQKYLARVQKGSEILVTWHGQVIARIMPPVNTRQEASKKLKELQDHCKIKDVISPLDEDWEADGDS